MTPVLPPMPHQVEALARARGRRGFGYFMEMGTGKSKVLIDEMAELYETGVIRRLLVTAGAGSYADWVREHLPRHWPPALPIRTHLWRGGASQKERGEIKAMMAGGPALLVLVMNTEAFSSSPTALTVATNFVGQDRFCAVAVDEASQIKNWEANRTRTLTKIARAAPVRRILTGSPGLPTDLWGLMDFLGTAADLGSNFFAFRAHYCEMVKMPIAGAARPDGSRPVRHIEQIVGYRDLDHLAEVVGRHSYRVLKEDCLNLPPKVYQRRMVPLTPTQKTHYQELSRRATTQLATGEWASADRAVTLIMRLHQISCGHLVDEMGGGHPIPTHRPAAVVTITEETEGKVVVWCAFRPDVARVAAALRARWGDDSVVEYHGGVKEKARSIALEGFENSLRVRFFVATQATGAYGIKLTASHLAVYYSNNRSLEHRLQSEDRMHRVGQTASRVTIIDLMSPGTVDAKIVAALRERKEVADTVAGDGLRSWLKWEDE